MTRPGLGGLGKISCKVRVQHVHPVAEQDQAEIRGVKVVKKAPTLSASLACIVFLIFSCTTTYRESDLADEPLDEPTGEVPNCSILANEPGCEVESPFDPRDEEL
jgi:hypothetical protein